MTTSEQPILTKPERFYEQLSPEITKSEHAKRELEQVLQITADPREIRGWAAICKAIIDETGEPTTIHRPLEELGRHVVGLMNQHVWLRDVVGWTKIEPGTPVTSEFFSLFAGSHTFDLDWPLWGVTEREGGNLRSIRSSVVSGSWSRADYRQFCNAAGIVFDS